MYQNPLRLGVDVVVHSGYLLGIALASKEQVARIRKVALSLGGSLNAETWALIERSLKTLTNRVERQTAYTGNLALSLEKTEKSS